MKGLIWALLFSTQLLYSQNNVAIFHANHKAVSVTATGGKAVSIAPFDLINGMILVKASVNGTIGNFILDTGSPGIVINSSAPEVSAEYTAAGVGGALAVGEITINHFKWGIIEKEELRGFTIDISHLEKNTGRKLAGLIGYEILQHYEVFFDYPNEIVKIYDAEHGSEFRGAAPATVVPFQINGHLPVIEVQVGNKTAFLGLDSGAEVNLLHESFYKQLDKSYLGKKSKEKVVGLDQGELDVVAAELNTSAIKGHQLPAMRFLFLDLNGLSGRFESKLDGLLGFSFFQQHAVSINYKEQKVYIWN